MLVIGEAGIGKTRLARSSPGRRSASAVAWGRCVDTDGAPPFWPWRQVLRALGATDVPVADAASPQDRFRAVDAAAGAVLDRRPRGGRCWSCSTTSTGPTSRRCSCCATSPTALPDAPLLLVATLRDAEPDAPLAAALPDLNRAPTSSGCGWRGLAEADVGRQLDALGAPA